MENNEFSKEVMSRNIRKYLGFNKMTATELAEKLNVSKASVSGWVNGNYYPRINYIEGMPIGGNDAINSSCTTSKATVIFSLRKVL